MFHFCCRRHTKYISKIEPDFNVVDTPTILGLFSNIWIFSRNEQCNGLTLSLNLNDFPMFSLTFNSSPFSVSLHRYISPKVVDCAKQYAIMYSFWSMREKERIFLAHFSLFLCFLRYSFYQANLRFWNWKNVGFPLIIHFILWLFFGLR